MGGAGKRFLPATPRSPAPPSRLTNGALGYSWVLGRDKQHAERCALIDALMQAISLFSKLIRNPYCPAGR
ncbi:phosphonate C-P lyase system protein PhnG [Escherichia coli]